MLVTNIWYYISKWVFFHSISEYHFSALYLLVILYPYLIQCVPSLTNTSAKLIDIYRNRHNISASAGLKDPAVATGISDLVYESKPVSAEPDQLSSDLTNAWAAQLDDDGLWGTNAPAMNRVRNLLCRSFFFFWRGNLIMFLTYVLFWSTCHSYLWIGLCNLSYLCSFHICIWLVLYILSARLTLCLHCVRLMNFLLVLELMLLMLKRRI